jgi:uncharacterized protein (TIGR02271 family)
LTQRSTVVGVFHDHKAANDAVEALKSVGFRDDQIGVAGRFDEGLPTTGKTAETGTHWEEGAAVGALTGAGLGALVGLGTLSGVIPVIGPVIAGGTLAVLAANAAGGAAIAGLGGALVGAGIPEEEARYYENEMHSGRTIVTVKAEKRAAEATDILRRFNAYDMETASASSYPGMTGQGYATKAASATSTASLTAPLTASSRATKGGETIRVHEEQLHADKTPVQTGEVRVRKEVTTEHKTIDVPVQREEVVIERRPVSGRPVSGETIEEGEEIRIPVKEDQVHVTKQAVVKEEVSVGKRVVTDTQRVGGDVRKEHVEIEREGNVDVRGDTNVKSPRKHS